MGASASRNAKPALEPLDSLLRAHHASIITRTYDDDEMPALSAKIFEHLRIEAEALMLSPLTAFMAKQLVLRHKSLEEAVGSSLAGALSDCGALSGGVVVQSERTEHNNKFRDIMVSTLGQPEILRCVIADLAKAWIADPACQGLFQVRGSSALGAKSTEPTRARLPSVDVRPTHTVSHVAQPLTSACQLVRRSLSSSSKASRR
jgi:hypothetical protein